MKKLALHEGTCILGLDRRVDTSLRDTSFENETSSDSKYPAPDDVLIAQQQIYLRQGPRMWDNRLRIYTSPPVVSTIEKGDRLKIIGDCVISGKWNAVWVPVQRVEDSKSANDENSILEKIKNKLF